MKSYHYLSKKIGTVAVKTDSHRVSLQTDRLVFKSLNQDLPERLLIDYSLLLGNPENVKLLNDGQVWSAAQVQAVLDLKTKAWDNGEPFGMFSVYAQNTGCFIGSLSLRKEPECYKDVGAGHAHAVEIGFIIDQAFWGKGYGTEIAIAAKKYIKHAAGIIASESEMALPKEMVATAHPENTASRAILQNTLKHVEPDPIIKYEGNPRIFFFKSLKPAVISELNSEVLCP